MSETPKTGFVQSRPIFVNTIFLKGCLSFYLQAVPQIASIGCKLLATLTLRQPAHCGKIIECNGHHVILQAMKIHGSEEQVQVGVTTTYFFSDTVNSEFFERIFFFF